MDLLRVPLVELAGAGSDGLLLPVPDFGLRVLLTEETGMVELVVTGLKCSVAGGGDQVSSALNGLTGPVGGGCRSVLVVGVVVVVVQSPPNQRPVIVSR